MPREAFDLRLAAPFVVLAEELHFGRAAERLGIRQPALSQQLARLERQLGVRLITRGGARIGLTPAGTRFLVEVREMLARISAAEAALRPGAGELRVNLGAANHPVVHDILGSFMIANPDVVVHSCESSATVAARAVSAGQADVGFTQPQDRAAGLGYARVASAPLGVVSAVDHPVAGRDGATWADIEGQTLIIAPPGFSDGWVALLRATLRRRTVGVREFPGLSSPKAGYAMHQLRSGAGVLIVPSWTLDPLPPGLAWTVLTPEESIELGVVWDDRAASELVHRFVAWARAHANPATAAPGEA